MSKEFGLDWQEYESKRMTKFIYLMRFENEQANSKKKKEHKFRPSLK